MNPALLLRRRTELMNAANLSPGEMKEIVALELMTRIAQAEAGTGTLKQQVESPREYYLKLYAQALRTVSGEEIEDILEGKK